MPLGKLALCVATLTSTVLADSVSSSSQSVESMLAELLRGPSPVDWSALSRFDGTITREEFERRLERPFDPSHGLREYLRIGDSEFFAYSTSTRTGSPVARIRFAEGANAEMKRPVAFRAPAQFRDDGRRGNAPPLAGLRIAVEPADIGGKWARMEDRSASFRGYGQINEGDLNLIVAGRLRERLDSLGAIVFLVRDKAEPVLPIPTEEALRAAEVMLRESPSMLPSAFQYKETAFTLDSPARLRIAAGLLVTKNAETRARADRLRKNFTPDLTVVLQFDASPGSSEGRLAAVNRNIFFVEGAYSRAELSEPEQRFRLLTKLLEGVTPIEVEVAGAIAERFRIVTGYPPVMYGNSPTTRLVLSGNDYVVARNLAFNREHDGPVVVTEPYLMNEPVTLSRLLAGDYPGERLVAGKLRRSIFREYADCVADGILAVYGSRTRP